MYRRRITFRRVYEVTVFLDFWKPWLFQSSRKSVIRQINTQRNCVQLLPDYYRRPNGHREEDHFHRNTAELFSIWLRLLNVNWLNCAEHSVKRQNLAVWKFNSERSDVRDRDDKVCVNQAGVQFHELLLKYRRLRLTSAWDIFSFQQNWKPSVLCRLGYHCVEGAAGLKA